MSRMTTTTMTLARLMSRNASRLVSIELSDP
jgi:hypothetical protein